MEFLVFIKRGKTLFNSLSVVDLSHLITNKSQNHLVHLYNFVKLETCKKLLIHVSKRTLTHTEM